MTKFITVAILTASFFNVFAQDPQQISSLRIQTDSLNVLLEFYSPSIVRIVKTKAGIKIDPLKNFSIIASAVKINVTKIDDNEHIIVKTDSLHLEINKSNGCIRFLNGITPLLIEDPAIQPNFIALTQKQSYFKVKQGFILEENETIYGLGQHQKGTLNQRNQVQILAQNNMEISLPVLQSIKGYGILWNNESPSLFADTLHQTYFLSDQGTAVDYFFIWGNNTDGVVKGIRTLSGEATLPPKWAFGFFQSKERYQRAEEVVDVVKKYRALRVPIDCIVQDWRYWGMDFKDWNSTAFGNPTFKNAQQMIDSVHDLHTKIIISVWPSFGINTDIYKSLQKAGYLYLDKTPTFPENALVYNAFIPEARKIVWNYMNKNLFSKGIDGWWLDATEPFEAYDFKSLSDAKFQQKLAPLKTMSRDTLSQLVANSYPLYTVGGVFTHQRKKSKAKRVFILTRSAYIGQQRFGAFTWSGDITSSFATLKKQIPAGLNLSLSGIPYWNTDIGGFWSGRYYPKGNNDPAYRELFVRWVQFGTFTGLMRFHGSNTPREIYQYGEKGDWAYDAIEEYIHLRYRLLPYTYSTAYQITTNGTSLMRPIFADNKNDKKATLVDDEFLFGNALLIAPVVESQYADTTGPRHVNFDTTKFRSVYLPENTDWIDFWTGEKIAGGQTVRKYTPIDIIPVYVKTGTILPLGELKQYVDEKKDSLIEIRIYPGADGRFTLYEDEGDHYHYESGKYSTIDFLWNNQQQQLTISNRKGTYPGMLQNRRFRIVLVDPTKGTGIWPVVAADKEITYNGTFQKIQL